MSSAELIKHTYFYEPSIILLVVLLSILKPLNTLFYPFTLIMSFFTYKLTILHVISLLLSLYYNKKDFVKQQQIRSNNTQIAESRAKIRNRNTKRNVVMIGKLEWTRNKHTTGTNIPISRAHTKWMFLDNQPYIDTFLIFPTAGNLTATSRKFLTNSDKEITNKLR